MERAKLYEYAVILYPTEDEAKAGKIGEIIVTKDSILALSQQAAVVAASRAIPEKYLSMLDRVEVAVRPFKQKDVLYPMLEAYENKYKEFSEASRKWKQCPPEWKPKLDRFDGTVYCKVSV